MEITRKTSANFDWAPHPSMPDHQAVVDFLSEPPNGVAQKVQNVWDNDPKVTSSRLIAKVWTTQGTFYHFYPKVIVQGEGLTDADLDNNVRAAVTVLGAQLNQPSFSNVRVHSHESTGPVDDPPEVKAGVKAARAAARL